MPLQNRVDPFGEIFAPMARGTLMGNRGCLHNDQQQLVRTSARSAWVTCRLSWCGIKRKLMDPGKYTELFFLDEVTALSAGHRPCNDCLRERLAAYKRAWPAGILGSSDARLLVQALDKTLTEDRESNVRSLIPATCLLRAGCAIVVTGIGWDDAMLALLAGVVPGQPLPVFLGRDRR